MTWWLWILLGFALLVVEMLAPGGFYFLFFGLSGVCVGLLALLGLHSDWMQAGVFGALALISMVAFRGALTRRFARGRALSDRVDAIAGEVATLDADLAAGEVGKAEFRGSSWNARNASSVRLCRGQRCRIERLEGLTLVVGPE